MESEQRHRGLNEAAKPGCSWGLNGGYYTFGKVMEDPSRDADDLEREYMEAAFGEAAEPMAAFFTTMHRRMEARQLLDRHETGNLTAATVDIPSKCIRTTTFAILPPSPS